MIFLPIPLSGVKVHVNDTTTYFFCTQHELGYLYHWHCFEHYGIIIITKLSSSNAKPVPCRRAAGARLKHAFCVQPASFLLGEACGRGHQIRLLVDLVPFRSESLDVVVVLLPLSNASELQL